MPNKYTDDDVKALADQLAQLQSGLLGYRGTPQMFAGPLQQQTMNQTGGTPPFVVSPQGYGITPGAGAFGPQGVLFAGGSPWPVSHRPAQIANTFVGLNNALSTLAKSGLLDKWLRTQQAQQSQSVPAPAPQGPPPLPPGVEPTDPSTWMQLPNTDLVR